MTCDNKSCACVRLDVERIREHFPVLNEPVRRGAKLTYFDNGATTQKPRSVIERVARFYEHENANVHRGVHWLSERATLACEAARDSVRSFINARSSKEVVFVRGTTEAINLVAQSVVRPGLQKGDEILITAMEHHSNIVPWQILAKQTGVLLKVIPISDDGELNLSDVDANITEKTKFISVVHISNALGTINPVGEIIKLAHAKNVPILLDGAQAVAHTPVDVHKLDCDFYAFSAHKMYGPTGIGVLFGKEELLKNAEPYQGGGDMILRVTFEETTYNDLPYKFEAGTPNIAGIVGLGAAVEFLQRTGLDKISAHEHELLEYATERLKRIDGLRIIGNAEQKAGIISFLLDDVHPHDVAHELDCFGIAARAGHHCAQPVMDRFGVPATTRVSLGMYNTKREIDLLVEVLPEIRKKFK